MFIKQVLLISLFQVFVLFFVQLKAQILWQESFVAILDTTKWIKGTISPNFSYVTQRRNLIGFSNTSDLGLRFKKFGVTMAQQIEFQKYGQDQIQSGGFVYLETRAFSSKFLLPELYAQLHWAEARGLRQKKAAGINGRVILFRQKTTGFFIGLGLFYEYENWDYSGIDNELLKPLPDEEQSITTRYIKNNFYISLKEEIANKIMLDFSFYHQAAIVNGFRSPRLAASISLKYPLTKHLNLIGQYQNIYDYDPIVPISPWFHRLVSSFQFSF